MYRLFFLFLFLSPYVKSSEVNGYIATIEDGVEKLCYASNYVARFLEGFNDRHLGKSEWGMMLGYEDIKPRISDGSDRGLKKPMMMAMLPLIFHVGAASTWMVLTSIMAVKSVAIGLILLVFKIAVSSAKVGSFFSQLKSKHAEPHAHSEYAWAPHAYKTMPTYKENEIILEDDIFENSQKVAEKKNG